MDIYNKILEHSVSNPQHLAFVQYGKLLSKTISYRAFIIKVNKYAGILTANNIKRNDYVIIDLKKKIDSYAAFVALLKIGADIGIFNENINNSVMPKAIVASGLNSEFIKTFKGTRCKFSTSKLNFGFINLNSNKQHVAIETSSYSEPAFEYVYSNKHNIKFDVEISHNVFIDSYNKTYLKKRLNINSKVYAIKRRDIIANLVLGVTTILTDAKVNKLFELIRKGKIDSLIIYTSIAKDLSNIAHRKKTQLPGLLNLFLIDNSVKFNFINLFKIYAQNCEIFLNFSIFGVFISEIDLSDISDSDYQKTYQGSGVIAGYDIRDDAIKLFELDNGFMEIILKAEEFKATNQLYEPVYIDGKEWMRTGKLGKFDEYGRLWYLGDKIDTIDVDGRTILKYCVEEAANAHEQIHKAVLLENYNTRILFVEPVSNKYKQDLGDIKHEINNLFECNLVQQLKVGKIPLKKNNPMHIDFTKIFK